MKWILGLLLLLAPSISFAEPCYNKLDCDSQPMGYSKTYIGNPSIETYNYKTGKTHIIDIDRTQRTPISQRIDIYDYTDRAYKTIEIYDY